jgi:hypothetical protein
MNLMLVYAIEGYSQRHNMAEKDTAALFRKHGIGALLRKNYNALHTQDLDTKCAVLSQTCQAGGDTMKNKYVFKGQDITTDVLFKIEHIVNILSEKEGMSFDDAYAMFAASNTYAALKRPDNLYWAESAEFLVDEYYRENGRL